MKKISKKTLKRALQDLGMLSKGHSPNPADLANAPILYDWVPMWNSADLMQLEGEVRGHPTMPDGPCTTSVVLIADVREGWAHTVSRYYRLGPQRGEHLH